MQRFTGREYLKIDVANNFGLDKLTWYERIRWFDQNQDRLDDLVQAAKEPALFYAGVRAWRDVLAGRPTGYMVSLDATSSGLQLLAALTGDSTAAQLCNVVDTGAREDAYDLVYRYMLNRIGDTAKISRDDCKNAIMTALYSSRAEPKRVFGEGALLDVFYDSLQTLAPAAWELNETMLALWDSNALEHSWVLPDNFHVRVKVMAPVRETVHFLNEPFDVFYNVNAPTKEGRSLGANTIHSVDGMIVRELTRRCDHDPRVVQRCHELVHRSDLGVSTTRRRDRLVVALWDHFLATGYLSARILPELDELNGGHVDRAELASLLGSLPDRPFRVVSIHDCFRCLPHYANDLRTQYNLQLQLIARSALLSFIVSQLVGRHVPVNQMDPTLWQRVAKANYALS